MTKKTKTKTASMKPTLWKNSCEDRRRVMCSNCGANALQAKDGTFLDVDVADRPSCPECPIRPTIAVGSYVSLGVLEGKVLELVDVKGTTRARVAFHGHEKYEQFVDVVKLRKLDDDDDDAGAWTPEFRESVRKFQSTGPAPELVVGRDIGAHTAAALGAAVRSRSGKNIPEMDRRTVAVKLRLSRDVAEQLRELAMLSRITLSEAVSGLIGEHVGRAVAPPPKDRVAHDSSGKILPPCTPGAPAPKKKTDDSIPAFVHKNIVDAYERQKAEASASTKHVLDELRAKLAKYEPKKKKKKQRVT